MSFAIIEFMHVYNVFFIERCLIQHYYIKENMMILKHFKKALLPLTFIAVAMFLTACDEEYSGPMCTTDVGLESGEYQSATVCYPCEMDDEDYPAVAVSGGFSNTKEQMLDYAETLVENGFIVVGVTPKGNYSTNHTYFRRALTEGFNKLKALNSNPESPIYDKVDTDRLAQVGYSMGGGAALLNSQADSAGDIKATVAICPYHPGVKPETFNAVSDSVMLLTGTADDVAPASNVVKMTDSILSGDHGRVLYANFQGLSHLDAVSGMGSAEKHSKILEYMVAFLKTELQGDDESESVISGDIQAQYEADGLFNVYDLYEAN